MRLDPGDHHVALEFAFLANETGHQRVARLVFDRVRATGNATAEQAFQNVDRPLGEGIARWQQALERDPNNFSAHRGFMGWAEAGVAVSYLRRTDQTNLMRPDLSWGRVI